MTFIVFLAFVARRRRKKIAVLHFANTIFIKKIDVSRAQSPKISRPSGQKLCLSWNPNFSGPSGQKWDKQGGGV